MTTRIATRASASICILIGLSGAASATVTQGPATLEPPIAPTPVKPLEIVIGSCQADAFASPDLDIRAALGLDPRPTAFIPILAF